MRKIIASLALFTAMFGGSVAAQAADSCCKPDAKCCPNGPCCPKK
jgi:hypothetical protein